MFLKFLGWAAGFAGKYAELLVVLLAGSGIVYFSITLFAEKIAPLIAPVSSEIRKELKTEVLEAERRSKEYADLKYTPLKETVDRMDKRTETILKILMKINQQRKLGTIFQDDPDAYN